jgi:hypothetical protein
MKNVLYLDDLAVGQRFVGDSPDQLISISELRVGH